MDSQGSTVDDEELLDLLSQTNNMSKKLEDYGKQKSAAITAAKRLGQFLLDDKLKEKGLVCSYIVSKVTISTCTKISCWKTFFPPKKF